jgi:hypothetical protein
LWKKWTERYQESREVGPSTSDGEIESGFFGEVNPTELIKFILRCPMSVHPKGKVRHKIGWGIASDAWTCCANETAECYYPDWVAMRTTGLCWKGRGKTIIMNTSTLAVAAYDGTNTDWNTQGVNPWLDVDDIGPTDGWITSHLLTTDWNDKNMGYFTFATLDPTAYTISSVIIKFHCRNNYYLDPDYCTWQLYDGTTWHDMGNFVSGYYWEYRIYNVTTILNTVAKVNLAKVNFTIPSTGPHAPKDAGIDITYACLDVRWTTFVDNAAQETNDWFVVNLDAPYNDVTAILVECRNNNNTYARNYKIQWTDLSDCCGVGGGTWNDFDPPVDVINNAYRDILHSWKPEDDVHCVRIMLTASANVAWEISQIYIWQGDEVKFRLQDV